MFCYYRDYTMGALFLMVQTPYARETDGLAMPAKPMALQARPLGASRRWPSAHRRLAPYALHSAPLSPGGWPGLRVYLNPAKT